MPKWISFTACIGSLLLTSTPSHAEIAKDTLVQQASIIVESGLNSTSLDCLGISKYSFNSALQEAKNSCGELIPNVIQNNETEHYSAEFGNCVSDGLRLHFDLSQNVIHECESQSTSTQTNLKQAAKRLNEGLQLVANKGDIKRVTLPLYDNYEIVSHFPDGMGNMRGNTSLPVAVLSSNDDIDNIIQFYQSNLPTYKEFIVEDGIILIEDAPDDFNLLTHIGLYTSTPHVLIEDMRFNDITAQEGDVKIEISYRKNLNTASR